MFAIFGCIVTLPCKVTFPNFIDDLKYKYFSKLIFFNILKKEDIFLPELLCLGDQRSNLIFKNPPFFNSIIDEKGPFMFKQVLNYFSLGNKFGTISYINKNTWVEVRILKELWLNRACCFVLIFGYLRITILIQLCSKS